MLKNILATMAAASLVAAPVAVQANTRAADAGVSSEALYQLRAPANVGAAEEGGEEGVGTAALLALLFGAAAAALVIWIENEEDDIPASNGN